MEDLDTKPVFCSRCVLNQSRGGPFRTGGLWDAAGMRRDEK